jgi:hypothetical protein
MSILAAYYSLKHASFLAIYVQQQQQLQQRQYLYPFQIHVHRALVKMEPYAYQLVHLRFHARVHQATRELYARLK